MPFKRLLNSSGVAIEASSFVLFFFQKKDPLNQHIAGTMWMALWNTLLIYQKIEKHMPVPLFLIPGWYQFSNRQSMSLQEFIVAGGSIPSYSRTDTVLSLLPGATSWTSIASLPLRLWSPRASVVGGKMRVVGGSEDGELQGARGEVIALTICLC